MVDMSGIISVSRESDELLLSVDEYFRNGYTRDVNFLSHKNALFAITWMVSSILSSAISHVYIYDYIVFISIFIQSFCFLPFGYFYLECIRELTVACSRVSGFGERAAIDSRYRSILSIKILHIYSYMFSLTKYIIRTQTLLLNK